MMATIGYDTIHYHKRRYDTPRCNVIRHDSTLYCRKGKFSLDISANWNSVQLHTTRLSGKQYTTGHRIRPYMYKIMYDAFLSKISIESGVVQAYQEVWLSCSIFCTVMKVGINRLQFKKVALVFAGSANIYLKVCRENKMCEGSFRILYACLTTVFSSTLSRDVCFFIAASTKLFIFDCNWTVRVYWTQ